MPNYRYNSQESMRRRNIDSRNRSSASYSNESVNRQGQGCFVKCDVLRGMPLAMAYVPWQNWQNLYDPEKGLCQGTIFSELDKPFWGMGGCCR